MKYETLSWFYRYLPQKLDELIFENEKDYNLVKNIIDNKCIYGNLMLSGLPGTGKNSILNVILKELKINSYDIKYTDGLISNLRELKPYVRVKPIKSIKKIIVLNEFSIKNYRKESIEFLKNEMLEVNQNNCSFIALTNYFDNFDDSLKRRFNEKINFIKNYNSYNIPKIIKRIKFILNDNNINYDDNIVEKFIDYEINLKHSISEIITNCQIFSRNGYFNVNYDDINNIIDNTGSIDNLFKLFNDIFDKIINSENISYNDLYLITILPNSSIISNEYNEILKLFKTLTKIDYYDFFEILKENYEKYLPIYSIIIDFENNINIPLKYINILSFLIDFIKTTIDIKSVFIIK